MDTDDHKAWRNRRMLEDESDGLQDGDLILLPHLPHLWRWSIVQLSGPYRYEVHPRFHDYGHLRPVIIVEADIDPQDVRVTDALRRVARYRGRLRRPSHEQALTGAQSLRYESGG